MGERFLYFRMNETDENDDCSEYESLLVGKALDNSVRVSEMRHELAEAVRELLPPSITQQPQADLMPHERDRLVTLAEFTSRCRSVVERDGYSKEIEHVHTPERGARVACEMRNLYVGLTAMGVERADAWAVLDNIAWDCIPDLRRRIIRYLATRDLGAWTVGRFIGREVNRPEATVRRALEDLEFLRVVKPQSKTKKAGWALSDWAWIKYCDMNR